MSNKDRDIGFVKLIDKAKERMRKAESGARMVKASDVIDILEQLYDSHRRVIRPLEREVEERTDDNFKTRLALDQILRHEPTIDHRINTERLEQVMQIAEKALGGKVNQLVER